MFSGIWAKITGALSIIVGFLLVRNKYLNAKNDKLEHDADIKDFKAEAAEKQIKDNKEILDNEQAEIIDIKEERSKLNKRERFNKL